MLIKNIPNQGDRDFLYVYGRKLRNLDSTVPSLDLIERSFKDTLIIKDCFIRKDGDQYKLYIEARKDLLDIKHIGWEELDKTIKLLAQEFKKNTTLDITGYAILEFHGIRNIVGKLQFFNL